VCCFVEYSCIMIGNNRVFHPENSERKILHMSIVVKNGFHLCSNFAKMLQ
jgi:hypothetical protein